MFNKKLKVRQRNDYKKNIAYQRDINVIHPIVRAMYFKVFMINPFRYRMYQDGGFNKFFNKILIVKKKRLGS
ncbi:hypothetical protein BHL07_18995 [Bacillus cereus]|nr:hypothetical protein MCCC1A01412_13965 [Bacillus anthracis]OPA38186.1 hypothetical protein BHL07_18995 [Bacillus cereus]